ncbi:MAG: NADPH-dependent FMN reductase [Candidatus Nanohalobium sp.]
MRFLVVLGTAREGRNSVYPAEKVVEEFEEGGHETCLYDLGEKDVPPLGNRTYRDEGPVPEDIQELSREVERSDGVVLVVPEYNHYFPGVLKTALDYLYPEYDDKPFSFVTVSAGGFGGVRALNHLHDIVLALGGFVGPDLQVSRVGDVFSSDGELVDDDYRERFSGFVEETEKFVRKVS